MNAAIDFLADQGAMLLSGSSLLLAAGAVAVACRRAPIERQRLAEISLVGVLAWLILGLVPLPRFHRPTAAPVPRDQPRGSVRLPIGAGRHMGATKPPPDPIDGKAQAEASRSLTVGRADQTPAPVVASVAWRRVAAISYLLGAAVAASWLFVSRILLWALVRNSGPPEPWLSDLLTKIDEPCVRRTTLRVSSRWGWPFSYGLVHATVVLPSRLCRPKHADMLRQVLLHELSHVAQRDACGHLLANLALPLLYFHPLYWWLRAAGQNAREVIADDWAARHSSPEIYAAHLIGLAREAASRAPPSWVALAAIGSSSQFYRRMTMLLKRENPLAIRYSNGWKIISLACAALIVAGAGWRFGIEPAVAQARQKKIHAEIDKTKGREEEQIPGDSLVSFSGPTDARVQWRSGEQDKSTAHVLVLTIPRGNVRFRQGAVHQLQLSNLPGRDGVVLYPTLEIRRSLPASEAFLKHSAIPVNFTEEDFDQALSGNLVTKAIFLPNLDQQERALAGVETLVSTRVDPGVDPVAEAKRKGTILAILRMGNAVAPLRDDATGWTAIESSREAMGVLQSAAAVGVEKADGHQADDAPLRRHARIRLTASQLDLVEWIAAYSDAVRDAEVIGYDLESHEKAEKSTPGVTPGSELRRMRVQKKAAERKVSLLLKLAKGALTSAKSEADDAESTLAALTRAEKDAAVATRAVREARRRHETARAEVELLESLLREAASD